MAKTHSLKAEPRTCTGTGKLNQLRCDGYVPGVVYGKGIETFNVQINARELSQLLANSGTNILVELNVDGKAHTALIKDVQRNALSGEYTHIDFLYVSADTTVNSTVTVELVGEPAGVKAGGMLDQSIHELAIACKVKDMPEVLTIDVTDLALGAALRIADITLPAGVTTPAHADVMIAHVQETSAAQSAGTAVAE